MPIITVDGVSYEVTEQVEQVVSKQQATIDTLTAAAATAETEKQAAVSAATATTDSQISALTAERDAAKQAESDALAKLPTPDQLDDLVNKRTDTVMAARKLVANIDAAGKDCETLRKEVVTSLCKDIPAGDSRLDDAVYVRARFDSLASGAGHTQQTLDTALAASVKKEQSTTDADEDLGEVEKARQAASARNRDAYK